MFQRILACFFVVFLTACTRYSYYKDPPFTRYQDESQALAIARHLAIPGLRDSPEGQSKFLDGREVEIVDKNITFSFGQSGKEVFSDFDEEYSTQAEYGVDERNLVKLTGHYLGNEHKSSNPKRQDFSTKEWEEFVKPVLLRRIAEDFRARELLFLFVPEETEYVYEYHNLSYLLWKNLKEELIRRIPDIRKIPNQYRIIPSEILATKDCPVIETETKFLKTYYTHRPDCTFEVQIREFIRSYPSGSATMLDAPAYMGLIKDPKVKPPFGVAWIIPKGQLKIDEIEISKALGPEILWYRGNKNGLVYFLLNGKRIDFIN